LHWSHPVSYYLELLNCAGHSQVALVVDKDKKIRVAQAVAKLRWPSPKIRDMRSTTIAKLRWLSPKKKDTHCAGCRQVALNIAKDKRDAFTQCIIIWV